MDYEKFQTIIQDVKAAHLEIMKKYKLDHTLYFSIYDIERSIFKQLLGPPKFKPGQMIKVKKDLRLYGWPLETECLIVTHGIKDDGRDRSEVASKHCYLVFAVDNGNNRKLNAPIYECTHVSEDEIELIEGK